MFPGERGQGKDVLAKLGIELERQADIYKGLVSKDVIMKLLAPRPEGLPEYLRIPIVTLGTSVDLERQAELAGIIIYYDFLRGYDTAGGITFGAPHLIWMPDGIRYLYKSTQLVLSNLQRNERLATQYDGVAFGIVYPDFRKLLRKHPIDLRGTFIAPDQVSYMRYWKAGPGLGHRFVRLADPDYRSLTCAG